MSSTMERLSSNQVKINFVVAQDIFDKSMDAAYKKLVKKINIPGFRKGHAPRKVIEMHYGGESVFYDEAFETLFPAQYREAVEEHKLDPVDRPDVEIEQIGGGKELMFSCTVYVKPEVTLGEYKGVRVEKHEHVIEDDDVTAELERARERVSRFVEITDRAVKMDDQVNINYAGFVGEEQFEGGTADGQTLVIGSGQFIPGFEEQLIGANIGDDVDVSVTFPTEYHSEALAGKEAIFHVHVNGIEEKEVPALDDEFAKDVSECDTLEDYKAQVREKLEKQNQDHIDAEFENDVIGAAVENAEVDIPDAMVEEQVSGMIRDMELRMMYQGLKMEDYLQYTGQSMEQMREMHKEDAERRVRTRLVLEAIKDTEQIAAEEADVDAEMEKYAEQAKKTIEEFKAGINASDKEYFEDIATVKKVIEFLKDNAVIENE